MLLNDLLRRQGDYLFRSRSYIPLFLVPVALASLPYSGYLEQAAGEFVEETYMVACLLLALLGQAIRCVTVGSVAPGTSGRNTRAQRADSLNTSGVYSVVRHPLYLGNFLVLLGMAMATQVWWVPIVASLAFVLHYERIIMAEEHYLKHKFGESYAAWAAQTPTIMPALRLWRPTERAFSLRKVLKREYNGMALILMAFPAIELGEDLLGEGEPFAVWLKEDVYWGIIFWTGVLLFFTLRFLKKHTRALGAS